MQRSHLVAAVCLLLGLATSAPVPALELLKDINTTPVQLDAAPGSWTALGDNVLFVMNDQIHGPELWRTNGTVLGTALVKDINPGPTGSNPKELTLVNGIVYFYANDGTNGQELWRSDGTADGTYIVADINQGPGDGAGDEMSSPFIPSMDGILYFNGTSSGDDSELWRSDGTTQGTYRVKDINPGLPASSPSILRVVGNRLFFVASDGTSNNQLWISDGTASGTRPVTGSSSTFKNGVAAGFFVAASNGVYFSTTNGTQSQLYYADASGQSVQLLTDSQLSLSYTQTSTPVAFGKGVIFSATVVSGDNKGVFLYGASGASLSQLMRLGEAGVVQPPTLVPAGNHMFFTGSLGGLWVTDGTTGGTLQLGSKSGLVGVQQIISPSAVPLRVDDPNLVYFLGGTSPSPSIWRSDGTDAGTYVFASTTPSFISSDLAAFQGKVYFEDGRFSNTGWEPWISDGTAAGTHLLADLVPGPGDSQPLGFTIAGDRVYFDAISAAGNRVPVVSDGTATGTYALVQGDAVVNTASSGPAEMTPFLNNSLLFTADDGVHQRQPWITDGTANGTRMIAVVTPVSRFILQPAGAYIQLGNRAILQADDGVHGVELWVTDGSTAGTQLLKDINPGSADSSPEFVSDRAILNNILYFDADDGSHGDELWRTDGTASGTYMVSDLTPGASGSEINRLHYVNGVLLFTMTQGETNTPWVSDGTAAGAHVLNTTVSVETFNPVDFNGFSYFMGSTASAQHQIWRTDGTSGGTIQISNAPQIAEVDGNLYPTSSHLLFTACIPDCALYSSDGNSASIQKVDSNDPQQTTSLGGLVYYLVNTGTYRALHVTDGTVSGTREVLRFPDGYDPQFSGFAQIHGVVTFTVRDPQLGTSLWRTDGSAAGTALVAVAPNATDIATMPFSLPLPCGTGDACISFNNAALGEELYILHGTIPNAGDDTASTQPETTVAVNVLANDGSWTSALNLGTVVVTSNPAHGAATIGSNGRISYTPESGFSGMDNFTYTVADQQGQTSKPATVSLLVAAPAGPSPGTAPAEGSSSGGSSSGGSSSGSGSGSGSSGGSGGGGGGAFDGFASLFLLAMAGLRRRTAAK